MIARLEGTADITSILDALKALKYDVVQQDKKIAFIYRGKGSSDDLKRDVKAAKDAGKLNSSIKCIHGTTNATY